MKLRFQKDGTFKIMQITDMQEIPAISKDTIALMERAVLEEQPDLVVYTGDQIKGYGVTYKGKGEELEREVAQTIGKLLEPVTKRGIPFAVTFGNHDCQVGISNQDQFYHIYKRLPNCIGEQAEGIDGGGTCAIPIEASDGSGRDVFELYLFDSGTDAREGGYEAFDPKIITWYRKQREDLREKNGMYVPSIVFQHIPMREYYEVLKLVDRGEKVRCALIGHIRTNIISWEKPAAPGIFFWNRRRCRTSIPGNLRRFRSAGKCLRHLSDTIIKTTSWGVTGTLRLDLHRPRDLMSTATVRSAACAVLY